MGIHITDDHFGYLYSTLAVTVCSLASLIGVPLVLADRNSLRMMLILQALMGLAVSSLSGDAVLHLLPKALGVHGSHGTEEKVFASSSDPSNFTLDDLDGLEEAPNSTSEDEVPHADDEEHHADDDDHDDKAESRHTLYIGSVVLASMYLLFVMESVMRIQFGSLHDHSHGGQSGGQRPRNDVVNSPHRQSSNFEMNASMSSDVGRVGRQLEHKSSFITRMATAASKRGSVASGTLDNVAITAFPAVTPPNQGRRCRQQPISPPSPSKSETKFGVPVDKLSLVIIITLGDMFHNFTDGLILGATFGLSNAAGIINTLAVFAHELPHELGDVAILYDCGLSMRRVVVLNLSAALTAYVGVYIGLAVSAVQGAEQWIAAVTAGMFIYIAFIDMLPQLLSVDTSYPWRVLIAQNIGVLTGGVCMFLLAYYEDRWEDLQ